MTQQQWAAVDHYLNDLLVPSDPVLDTTLATSADAGLPAINVAPNQGKLLNLLVLASGARTVLEIGTLGGYSAIWLAPRVAAFRTAGNPRGRSSPCRGGTREHISRRAVGRHRDPRRPRHGVLAEAQGAQHRPPFDLVFIDADKPSTAEYFAWSLELSHVGTLIVVDNVVRGGQVAESGNDDKNVQGMRRFLVQLANEPRVSATAVQTVGLKGYDGFVLALVTAAAR